MLCQCSRLSTVAAVVVVVVVGAVVVVVVNISQVELQTLQRHGPTLLAARSWHVPDPGNGPGQGGGVGLLPQLEN